MSTETTQTEIGAPQGPPPGTPAVAASAPELESVNRDLDSHARALADAQALADAAASGQPSPLSVGAGATAKKSPTKDSREHQRAVVAWRARVLLSSTQFLEARVVDISEAGAGLECDRSFPVGSILTLLMAVPDLVNRAQQHVLKLKAMVRFQVLKGGAVRMGVQLMNLDPEHRRMLVEWVARGNPNR